MERIGMFDAKTRFSEIVRRVQRSGKPILITSRGQVVAQIAPVEDNLQEQRRRRHAEAVETIRKLRVSLPPTTMEEIRSAIAEGRK